MYSRDELKAKMAETTLPTLQEYRALKARYEQAQTDIQTYEEKIATAQQSRNYWNYDQLRANLEAARTVVTDTQHELARVGHYGPVLEAQERDRIAAAERQKQRERTQLEFAAQQEAESKAEYREHYLRNGGTPEAFERAWPALWAEELHKRTVQGTDALRQRMLASGKYS